MSVIPSEITWNGLRRVKVLDRDESPFDVTDVRVGKKTLKFKSTTRELRFEKLSRPRDHQVRVELWDHSKGVGRPGYYESIYFDAELMETLAGWLREGAYIPPKRLNGGAE